MKQEDLEDELERLLTNGEPTVDCTGPIDTDVDWAQLARVASRGGPRAASNLALLLMPLTAALAFAFALVRAILVPGVPSKLLAFAAFVLAVGITLMAWMVRRSGPTDLQATTLRDGDPRDPMD